MLKSALQGIFPKEEVFEEYKHPDIVSPMGHKLELDYFYPHLKLALEYQVFKNNSMNIQLKGCSTL
jgi:hypothetical protein